MQKTIILILFVLIIPIAYSIENCKDILEPSDIPCQILSSWNYTPDCTSHTAIVLNSSGENIANYPLINYASTGLCYFYWNITQKGSYTIQTDTGDIGSIIVGLDNMQIAFVLGLGIIIAAFLFLAFKLEDQHFFLKLALIFFSVIAIGLIPVVFLVNNISLTFQRLILGFTVLFWVYVFAFIGYYVLLKLGWVASKKQ